MLMVPTSGKPAFRYGHPADGRPVGEKGDVIISLIAGTGSREVPQIPEKTNGSKIIIVGNHPSRSKPSELKARARDSSLPHNKWTISPRFQGLILLNLVSLYTARYVIEAAKNNSDA